MTILPLLVTSFLQNVELVHPLPAAAEDELGMEVHATMDVANTTAGSGLHEASCWLSVFHLFLLRIVWILDSHLASMESRIASQGHPARERSLFRY